MAEEETLARHEDTYSGLMIISESSFAKLSFWFKHPWQCMHNFFIRKHLEAFRQRISCVSRSSVFVSAALLADTNTAASEPHTCTAPSQDSVMDLNPREIWTQTAKLVPSDMWILSCLLFRVTRLKRGPALFKRPVWQMSAQVSHFVPPGKRQNSSLSLSIIYDFMFFFPLCTADPNEQSDDSKVATARDNRLSSRTAEEMVNCTTVSFYMWGICICSVFGLACRLCGVVAAQGG